MSKMDLNLIERSGKRFIEGPVSESLLHEESDFVKLIEECFNQGTKRVLLHSENLTGRFFDLSSLEAGSILQKLRTYNIRLAVLSYPNVQVSQRFRDLMIEENRQGYFRLFEQRDAAEAWLLED